MILNSVSIRYLDIEYMIEWQAGGRKFQRKKVRKETDQRDAQTIFLA